MKGTLPSTELRKRLRKGATIDAAMFGKLENLMIDGITAIKDLTAAVEKQTTVDASATTLIKGFPALLAAAIAADRLANPGADFSAVEALALQITQNSDPLAAAVLANTPAAPPVVQPPAPVGI